jgi:SAP domain
MSLRVGSGPLYDINLDEPLSEEHRVYLADRDPLYRDVLGTSAPTERPAELPDSYEEWTVPQLQDELAARELPTGGRKAELVDRLAENDERNP